MLRRGIVAVAGALALWTAFKLLLPLFASDETRIRLLLADACDAYDEASARGVVEVVAPHWRDRTTGAGRDELRDMLLVRFLTERDPLTRAWMERVEIDPRSLVLRVDGDAGTAQAELEFVVRRLRPDADAVVVWRASAILGLETGPQGWQVTASEWTTLEGRPW